MFQNNLIYLFFILIIIYIIYCKYKKQKKKNKHRNKSVMKKFGGKETDKTFADGCPKEGTDSSTGFPCTCIEAGKDGDDNSFCNGCCTTDDFWIGCCTVCCLIICVPLGLIFLRAMANAIFGGCAYDDKALCNDNGACTWLYPEDEYIEGATKDQWKYGTYNINDSARERLGAPAANFWYNEKLDHSSWYEPEESGDKIRIATTTPGECGVVWPWRIFY